MNEALAFAREALPALVLGLPAERPGGLVLSLLLGLTAAAVGFVLAVPLGVSRAGYVPGLRLPAIGLIETVRGLPLVYLLLLVHTFGSAPFIGRNLSPTASALIALTLYATVHQAEILRAGLRSVPRQEIEAALATGLGRRGVLRWIELPQALRRMAPALTGHTVSIFKDSSVVLVLGVPELMTVARLRGALGNDRHFLLLYFMVALLYLGTSAAIGRAGRWIERTAAAPPTETGAPAR